MLEEEIFRKTSFLKDRMVSYGFREKGRSFVYEEVFHDGDFRAEVTVHEDGSVTGRVIDVDTEDEYIPVHIDVQTTGYAGEIREGYRELLIRLRDACCRKELFGSAQTNRVTSLIRERYGEQPDFPFRKMTSFGVFRHQNGKWYALIMDIPSKSLLADGDDTIIDVLNIKARYEELSGEKGIYPAYHMNHLHWISIIMNDSVSDERIMELIETARNSVSGHKNRSDKPVSWIVPANPAYYDIDGAFRKKKGVVWKQGKGIKENDIVYMYVGAPVSAVRYRCIVRKTMIPYEFSNDEVRMTHLMEMDVEREYEPDYCNFRKLNELGIRAVRGPRTIGEKVVDYLDAYEK